MLRSVLVCLDATPPNEACQAAAVRYALHYGARLKGLYVREALRAGESDVERQEAADLEERAIRPFVEMASREGLEVQAQTCMGDVAGEIERAAMAADLVVIGRGAGRAAGPIGSVASAIVRRGRRAFLLVGNEVPASFAPILVAYDGSAGADRALAAAADIAWHWKPPAPQIVLLTVATGAGDFVDHLASAVPDLESYGLPFASVVAAGSAGQAIPEAARAQGAGLVCMGAYGRSALREAILGSTTEQVVAAWAGPLLLCR
jgi:nucleotide-binding universal stress UspA family protein